MSKFYEVTHSTSGQKVTVCIDAEGDVRMRLKDIFRRAPTMLALGIVVGEDTLIYEKESQSGVPLGAPFLKLVNVAHAVDEPRRGRILALAERLKSTVSDGSQ
jgi:hypothetical protein